MQVHFNFLLFDAARAEGNLYRAMELNPSYQSLYKGWAEDDMEGVAPYLFAVKPETDFANWFLEEGWDQNWGLLIFANVAFDDLYKHFRKFLMIKTEDGQQMYFRFYDPRVLRAFLPTCNGEQIKEIFGPIRHFITEGEEPGTAIRLWHENYELKSEMIRMDENITESIEKKTQSDVEVKEPQVVKIQEPEMALTSVPKEKKKWKFDID